VERVKRASSDGSGSRHRVVNVRDAVTKRMPKPRGRNVLADCCLNLAAWATSRPRPLSVRDGSAGTTACESLVLLLAIGTIVTRQCGAIEVMYPQERSHLRACYPEQRQPEARPPRISIRASLSRAASFGGPRLSGRTLHGHVNLTLEINSLTWRLKPVAISSAFQVKFDTADQFIDAASQSLSQGQFALEPR